MRDLLNIYADERIWTDATPEQQTATMEAYGAFGEVARPPGEDRAAISRRPATLDDVVTEAPEGIGLLTGQVEIVMNDNDTGHLTPPRDRASVRSPWAGYQASVGPLGDLTKGAGVTPSRAVWP